jgi:YVTN family beta-propeller protein
MNKKLFVFLAVSLVCLLTACGGGTASHGVTAIPPIGTVSATISGLGPLSGQFDYYGMAADDTSVWVHNGDGGTLLRIDTKTNAIVATISVGAGEGGVAIGEGSVWVANSSDQTISRIDPQTNQVIATIRLNGDVTAITASPGAIWASDSNASEVVRIDPSTNKVVATISNQLGVSGLSFGAGSTWVANHSDTAHGLTRLNPASNQVQTQINTGGDQSLSCTAVTALDQTVWTLDLILGDGSSVVLERIDPATNKVVATISVPDTAPFQIAADDHGVWVYGPDTLYRVDPNSNKVMGKLPITGGAGVALGAGSVWVADGGDGTLQRIALTA